MHLFTIHGSFMFHKEKNILPFMLCYSSKKFITFYAILDVYNLISKDLGVGK